MRKWMLVVLMMVASTAMAQQLDLKALDKLAAKAKSTTQIDMDEAMLKSGAGLLNDGKKDEAIAKQSVEGLKGLFMRVYEFKAAGDLKMEDVKPITDQLKGPVWVSFMRVKEENEQVEIWMHRTNNEVDGMMMLVASPKEFFLLNVVGLKNVSDLSKLKSLGVPEIPLPFPAKED